MDAELEELHNNDGDDERKTQAHDHVTEASTVTGAIARTLDNFTSDECSNYLANSGHQQT